MRYFVIRGFGTKKDSAGQVIDFDRVDRDLITPALEQCGFKGGTTGEISEAGNIREDMFALILEADIVICDITVHNANVFYELGVRHALRAKHTVLIKGNPSADTTPFDLMTDRYLSYEVASPGKSVDALVASIKAGLVSNRRADSPIFLMLPKLVEPDVSQIRMVPLDFLEEVKRAEAAQDKGWLRLLAEEVRGERFEWDGLKAIGRAQWSLKDYDGARRTWETVRNVSPGDLDANLALANVLERLGRATRSAVRFEESNHAIGRVLEREDLTPYQRAEALALHARNLKTLWRIDFEGLATVDERRARALDIRLLQSYEAYRKAFLSADLNSYFPGIAAYQAGRILQSLAPSPNWRNLFGRDSLKAQRYREDLDRQLASLETVVAASISRSVEIGEGDERMWAEISDADLLFLTEPEESLEANPDIAVQSYRGAIPAGKRFAWDATRGQLDLFRSLGIRPKAADAVIRALDGPPEEMRKLHLVVFTGHTVDPPNAAQKRFPAKAEENARNAIAESLRRLRGQDEQMSVLASAAPGADILALEVCAELKIPTTLCLPMEPTAVASAVFKDYDAWRGRLFAIVKAHENKRTLILQNDPALPRWLRLRPLTPWERGNRWVLHLAQAWGADRVTLLALWDKNEQDMSTAGTAQMVRLAREAGSFQVEVIDSREL